MRTIAAASAERGRFAMVLVSFISYALAWTLSASCHYYR
jgi:hypothetical protein